MASWNSKYPAPTIGTTFGEWTVIEDYSKSQKNIHDKLTCKCSCGITRDVIIHNLLKGMSTSCGHNQYAKNSDPDIIKRRKNVYTNRIGEQIDTFTLSSYEELEDGRHLFTLTCPNGHDHILHRSTSPVSYVKQSKLTCWCEEPNAVIRMRKRKGYALEDVGQIVQRSRERIRQYENILISKRDLKKGKRNMTDEELMLNSRTFTIMADAYDLTDNERQKWVKEIIHGTVETYHYNSPTPAVSTVKKSDTIPTWDSVKVFDTKEDAIDWYISDIGRIQKDLNGIIPVNQNPNMRIKDWLYAKSDKFKELPDGHILYVGQA